MQTTPYLETPFPDASDPADVPSNLYAIAANWENAWAGLWLDWAPVVTQSSGGAPQALTLNSSLTHARVRRIGLTVYVQALITVSANPGALTGYPLIFLPYRLANAETPAGLVTSSVGGGISTVMAKPPGGGSYAGNTGVIEAFGSATARVATDWFGLLLRYETA